MGKLFATTCILMLAALAGGCVSTTGQTAVHNGAMPRARVSYALAQTYYEVSLISSDTQLKLKIRGPLFDADLDRVYQLDMRHSGFASDRFEIDRDENNMLEVVTLQSRGRANAIAYNLGASLGAVASMTGDAEADEHTETAETRETTPPRETEMLRAILRPGSNDATTSATGIQQRINTVVSSWFTSSCNRRGVCAPAQAPVVSLASALQQAAQSVPAPDCTRVICYSAQARATLQIDITAVTPTEPQPTTRRPRGRTTTPAVTRVANADLGTARSITLIDPAVSSQHQEYVDARMAAMGGGSMQLAFQRGALSYVSFARQSEVESAVLLPYDVIRGAANSVYSVLPVRIAIDYQRRQLDTGATSAPSAPASMSVPAVTNSEQTPPEAAQAPAAAALETREPQVREFVLAEREAPPQPAGGARGAGGAGGATGGATTPATPGRT